jgi:hypothetical protein
MPIPEDVTGRVIPEVLPLGTLEEHAPAFSADAAGPPESSDVPEECGRMEAMVRARLSSLRAQTAP